MFSNANQQVTDNEGPDAFQDSQTIQTALIADPNTERRKKFNQMLEELGYLTNSFGCLEDFLQSRPFGGQILLISEDMFNSSEQEYPFCINKAKHDVVLVKNSSTEYEPSAFGYDNVIHEPVEKETIIDLLDHIEKKRRYADIMSIISGLLFIESHIDSEFDGTEVNTEQLGPESMIRVQIEQLFNQADTITNEFCEEEFTKLFKQINSNPILIDEE